MCSIDNDIEFMGRPFFPLLLPFPDTSSETLNQYLSDLIGDTFKALEEAGCVELGGGSGAKPVSSGPGAAASSRGAAAGEDEEGRVAPTAVGRIASFYYLDHSTMAVFAGGLGPDLDVGMVLQVGDGAPGGGWCSRWGMVLQVGVDRDWAEVQRE